MTSRPFGSSGVSVPVFGQGTWQMEGDDRQGAIAALRAGIDLGLTHIDTAELYGSGRVEEMVAEAIDGRRDELFLVSKVMPSHATRAGTIRACEQSLKRLRTDRLDCYLLHWPGSHPLEETIGAFETLLEGGKIRAWGVKDHLQPGALSLGSARHRERSHSVVREAERCSRRLHAVWSLQLSAAR
jgi:diketogulonate reductase-like aldo/keto reductase